MKLKLPLWKGANQVVLNYEIQLRYAADFQLIDTTMINPSPKNHEAIYLALASVPAGKVITYGNLAKLAGMPKAARQVGKILCQLPKSTQLPWHRVINAQGKISLPEDSDSYNKQKQRLIKEGVEFKNGKISLARFGFFSN